MEGVRSRKRHVGLRSGSVTRARAFAKLKSYPNVRLSLQYKVLRKKKHEVLMRYLASDIQADVLA